MVGQLAIITAALFTGAALYINLVEQPARLQLDHRSLLAEWKPAYKRGAAMQAPLAAVSFLFGLAAWWHAGHPGWAIGALLMIANWPVTIFLIMPTNNRLMEIDPSAANSESRDLIVRWGALHATRTGLGVLASAVYLWASLA